MDTTGRYPEFVQVKCGLYKQVKHLRLRLLMDALEEQGEIITDISAILAVKVDSWVEQTDFTNLFDPNQIYNNE